MFDFMGLAYAVASVEFFLGVVLPLISLAAARSEPEPDFAVEAASVDGREGAVVAQWHGEEVDAVGDVEPDLNAAPCLRRWWAKVCGPIAYMICLGLPSLYWWKLDSGVLIAARASVVSVGFAAVMVKLVFKLQHLKLVEQRAAGFTKCKRFAAGLFCFLWLVSVIVALTSKIWNSNRAAQPSWRWGDLGSDLDDQIIFYSALACLGLIRLLAFQGLVSLLDFKCQRRRVTLRGGATFCRRTRNWIAVLLIECVAVSVFHSWLRRVTTAGNPGPGVSAVVLLIVVALVRLVAEYTARQPGKPLQDDFGIVQRAAASAANHRNADQQDFDAVFVEELRQQQAGACACRYAPGAGLDAGSLALAYFGEMLGDSFRNGNVSSKIDPVFASSSGVVIETTKPLTEQVGFFVADLGDGFRGTYKVFHKLYTLLANTQLQENQSTLNEPLLILGGDLMYPGSSPDICIRRLRYPVEVAQLHANITAQALSVLPFAGNHDHFDGLRTFQTFLASMPPSATLPEKIRKVREEKEIANLHPKLSPTGWTSMTTKASTFGPMTSTKFWTPSLLDGPQASAFAPVYNICLDGGIHGDIDFVLYNDCMTYLKKLPSACRVIVMLHQPFWLVHKSRPFLDALIAKLVETKVEIHTASAVEMVPRLLCVIAGDIHCYRRDELILHEHLGYGTNNQIPLIVNGAGGAFLHLPHLYKAKTPAGLAHLGKVKDSLVKPPNDAGVSICYPSAEVSKGLFNDGIAGVKRACLAWLALCGPVLGGHEPWAHDKTAFAIIFSIVLCSLWAVVWAAVACILMWCGVSDAAANQTVALLAIGFGPFTWVHLSLSAWLSAWLKDPLCALAAVDDFGSFLAFEYNYDGEHSWFRVKVHYTDDSISAQALDCAPIAASIKHDVGQDETVLVHLLGNRQFLSASPAFSINIDLPQVRDSTPLHPPESYRLVCFPDGQFQYQTAIITLPIYSLADWTYACWLVCTPFISQNVAVSSMQISNDRCFVHKLVEAFCTDANEQVKAVANALLPLQQRISGLLGYPQLKQWITTICSNLSETEAQNVVEEIGKFCADEHPKFVESHRLILRNDCFPMPTDEVEGRSSDVAVALISIDDEGRKCDLSRLATSFKRDLHFEEWYRHHASREIEHYRWFDVDVRLPGLGIKFAGVETRDVKLYQPQGFVFSEQNVQNLTVYGSQGLSFDKWCEFVGVDGAGLLDINTNDVEGMSKFVRRCLEKWSESVAVVSEMNIKYKWTTQATISRVGGSTFALVALKQVGDQQFLAWPPVFKFAVTGVHFDFAFDRKCCVKPLAREQPGGSASAEGDGAPLPGPGIPETWRLPGLDSCRR